MLGKLFNTLVALYIFKVRIAFCLYHNHDLNIYSELLINDSNKANTYHKHLLKEQHNQDEYNNYFEKLCPKPEDIAPCLCVLDTEHSELNLDCRAVVDITQLQNVFQAEFPETSFNRLDMSRSSITVLPSGVFGNITFKHMDFLISSLEVVEDGAFGGSVETLKDLSFQYCNITQFPFESIKNFKVIESIWLRGNKYSAIPSFESDTLKWMTLGSPYLTEIPEFLPNTLPALEDLQFNDSPITNIVPGHFKNLHGLQSLSFRWLQLSGVLTANSFVWDEGQVVTWIDLFHNNYYKIEPGAIQFTEGMYVDIRFNLMDTLEEEVWRPLLELNGTLEVQGLDINCDCGIAWIVTNPQFLEYTVDAFCADGTSFFDLDPKDYIDC
ncbi:unnamed protein product [Meganyctiphanes norvegica]|uniref:Uncharacterized protein n=1 Tax=Meganyctiphanes norvegica TaxID=48144 RepID=A0AAV2PL48_MEGNR